MVTKRFLPKKSLNGFGAWNIQCVEYLSHKVFHFEHDALPLGHIGFTVPDVEKACERFEKLGVTFVKKPNDGEFVLPGQY